MPSTTEERGAYTTIAQTEDTSTGLTTDGEEIGNEPSYVTRFCQSGLRRKTGSKIGAEPWDPFLDYIAAHVPLKRC
jgi:hypothetical protein